MALLALGAAAFLGGIIIAMLAYQQRISLLLASAVLGLLAGLTCASAASCMLIAAQAEATAEPASTKVFEAISDGSEGMYGANVVARTKLTSGKTIDVRLQFDKEAPIPRYGEVFEAHVSLSAPSAKEEDYCWQQHIAATAKVSERNSRHRSDAIGALLSIRASAIEDINHFGGQSDAAAVLQALICGSRAQLGDSDIYNAFKASGLAHLIAVSGAHLVVVSAFVGSLLKLLRAPRWVFILTQLILIGAYLVLSAAPISAIRAAIMVAASMTAYFAQRRPASLNALGICILLVIVTSPQTALSVSFALSALSTLGIVLFAGFLSSWISTVLRFLPDFALEAIALTLASSLTTQLIAASFFSQVSLVSPLANVVTAPLFAPLCAGGLVASLTTVFSLPLGELLMSAALWASECLCLVVRGCAALPYASIPLVVPFLVAALASLAVVVALWYAWPKPHLQTAAVLIAGSATALVALVLIAPRFAGNEIIMLNVGQGDAFVVRSEGATILIDTGNQDKLLREALARHSIYSLDGVVITHGDDDHCGSLSSLNGVVQVERVLLASDALTCACEACASLRSSSEQLVGAGQVYGLSQGDHLSVGVFDLSVVWPQTFSDEGGNADSVCLLAQADTNRDGTSDYSALFTGDAEHDQIAELLEHNLIGAVDIYKVGHHGSKNALTPHLANQLNPRLALVSAGEGNRYGHPAAVTLESLDEVGSRIYRTDQQGDVSCKLEAEGVVVKTLR